MGTPAIRPLLEGEKILSEWGTFKLTNLRLFQESKISKVYNLTSVPLDEVRMVSVGYFENRILLYLGVLFSAAGSIGYILCPNPPSGAVHTDYKLIAGLVLATGLIMLFQYVSSRHIVVSILTNLGKLEQKVRGKKTGLQEALELLTLIEAYSQSARQGISNIDQPSQNQLFPAA